MNQQLIPVYSSQGRSMIHGSSFAVALCKTGTRVSHITSKRGFISLELKIWAEVSTLGTLSGHSTGWQSVRNEQTMARNLSSTFYKLYIYPRMQPSFFLLATLLPILAQWGEIDYELDTNEWFKEIEMMNIAWVSVIFYLFFSSSQVVRGNTMRISCEQENKYDYKFIEPNRWSFS